MSKHLASAAELEQRLAALKGDEWDSASEEEIETAETSDSFIQLPTVKSVVETAKKKRKGKRTPTDTNGVKLSPVVYIGHIPHGFYEDQMKGYFSQFGDVRRLRLSRSKRTGNSKGYGFIEFEEVETATIVAESMDNYMLADKVLVIKQLPRSKLHKKLWKGAGGKVPVVDNRAIEVAEHHKSRTSMGKNKVTRRVLKKEDRKRKRMHDIGIDYEFPGYAACLSDDHMQSSTKETSKERKQANMIDQTKEDKLQGNRKKVKVQKENEQKVQVASGGEEIPKERKKKSKVRKGSRSITSKGSVD